ncbi:YraN family protein [Microbacterium telephonicum]|uniref:UPF0102 protein C7474_1484 n=1 Tax=Microbacterium telephonicum TaxID=1714841 RepID=A0A498C2R9_9MICO|nr:YraN family protein [Microbacterium telephonicum]RLK49339.1 putative endonuclease [Microbacterium telephonicum]
MADKDERGRAGENRAAAHLIARGWTILDRNWRSRQGEIDIVAERGRDLAVVEVKTRRTEAYGHPFDAVDARKYARLWRLAREWCVQHPHLAHARVLRVDVIGITGDDPETAVLEHVEDLR